jgi:hypothetical protein
MQHLSASVFDPPQHSVMGLHDRDTKPWLKDSYHGFSDGHGTESAVKWLEVIQPVGCQVQRLVVEDKMRK